MWIMGSDNLRSFHRWQKWRAIADLVPIAVVDRLGPSLYAAAGPAGQALARARIPEGAARTLSRRKPPAWVFLHGLKSPLSSTALRATRRKGREAAQESTQESTQERPASRPRCHKRTRKAAKTAAGNLSTLNP